MTGLKIYLLGGLQITRADFQITDFISNKVPALLAYLAVTHRAHSREKLASLFWGGMPDVDAKNNLRQALTNLRKCTEDELTITRDSVELTGDFFLDSSKFESDSQFASSLDPESTSVILTNSLHLYQGDFLDGFHIRDAPEFEDWMLAERSRLRELALQALHTLTHFHSSHGDFKEAISFASRLLSFDAWREEAHRQLMLLQARTGQFSAALSQYERCKKILEKELGVEPSLETTSLYERIRSARQSARHNIPASSTEFIGREEQLENLRQRLADPACRLITLVGLGGVGKTRLAQEVALQCADMFINGAWMVQLAAIDEEGLIPALGNIFDFPFSKGDPKKQILNFFRQKELLLVLDNFEHLLNASILVSEILKAAPEVKILITSREQLDVDGEWVVELSGLRSDSLEADQLFVQSVRRVQPASKINEQDLVIISDICRLLGGLPLGIEIAAAWNRSMSLETIRTEIKKNLDFLESSRRDIPERQRSLRAVFESSWARLSDVVKKTFATLSVFRGGFTYEAAEEIAGNFSLLVDRSLVQKNGDRFELHEVLRKFAEEKLSATEKVYNAHAAYFARWTRNCLTMPEHESFSMMKHEFENVRAAWIWSAAQMDVPIMTDLAPFIKRYLDVQARYHEGMELFGFALEKLNAPQNADILSNDARDHFIARLLMYNALWIADAGKPDDSLVSLISCLAYFRRTNDEKLIAVCLNGLGNAKRFLGQEEEASVFYREELEIARQTNNRDEEGIALNNLALTINTMGNFREAERLHREGLALRRKMEDYPGLSSTLINLGVVLFDQRRYEEAKPLLYEAIDLSRKFNHPRNLAASLGNLGGILLNEGKYEEALKLFEQGLQIHRNTGYRFGIAIALDNVGTAHHHLGHEQDAIYYLKQSIREARDIKADFIILDALVWLAALKSLQGEKETALEILSLIQSHPKTDPETLQNIERILSEISKGISKKSILKIEESGKSRDLYDLVDELLR